MDINSKDKRKCNICGKEKKPSKFKHQDKKTCIKCETRWYYKFLRTLVKDRQLTAVERISYRLGYMGSAFILVSPYLIDRDNLGYITYCIGALLSLPQVIVNKSWNIVMLNINLLIGYGYRLF